MIVWDGIKITSLGLVGGAAAALVLARILASQLYGLSYADPATYVAVAAALTTVTLAASVRPALLAARGDPSIVLRED